MAWAAELAGPFVDGLRESGQAIRESAPDHRQRRMEQLGQPDHGDGDRLRALPHRPHRPAGPREPGRA